MNRRNIQVEYTEGLSVSTASNREDVLLWRAFRGREKGFYIDIGAGDPNYGNVTRWFYCKGWRGINVEPHPEVFRILDRWRPEDVNLNCAVSNRKGRFAFYKVVIDQVGLGWGLSSFDSESAENARAGGAEVEEIPVETTTLADIVEQHCSNIVVDYLKIDVESHEEAVIRSADWSRFRPKVLCIEATLPNSATPCFHQWEYLLVSAGYTFALFDGINNYYVRQESPEILPQFNCGVNSADHWRPAAKVDFREPWLQPLS
jgi:FkbM family methyltransferase